MTAHHMHHRITLHQARIVMRSVDALNARHKCYDRFITWAHGYGPRSAERRRGRRKGRRRYPPGVADARMIGPKIAGAPIDTGRLFAV